MTRYDPPSNMQRLTLLSIILLFVLYLTNTCSAQEPTPTSDVPEVSTIISSSESNTTNGNIAEDTIISSMDSVMSESPTGDPEFCSSSTSDFSSSYPIPEDTSTFTVTTTPCPIFLGSPQPTDEESPTLIWPTLQSEWTILPDVSTLPASVPMSSPSSMEAETPTPSAARTQVTTVIGGPITVTNPTHTVNTPRPFGVNEPINTPGNILRSSVRVAENIPQSQNGERFTLTLVAVGTSTTLSIVTEITLGIDTWSTPGTSMVAGTQESFGGIGPAVTSTHVPNNDIVRGRLPPAAIGAIVGSLLGALTLWILLVVWLKKRKKAQAFQQMEDTWLHKSSPEMNRITPFVPPPPKPSNSFNPDSKRRFVQEMPRATSPVTSIGDTGIHSEFLSMPITESLSEDLYPVASSDPFKRLSESHRDRKETQPGGSGC